jgi:hypothetical protein
MQMEKEIRRLTRELEDNLSLGNLAKMNLRKQLATLKADYNRRQAR